MSEHIGYIPRWCKVCATTVDMELYTLENDPKGKLSCPHCQLSPGEE